MSAFEVPVVRVQIEPHPNADAIEIAVVGGYKSIVRKGVLKDGDLAVYIPEQAVVPEWLLKELGLWDSVKEKGALSKSAGNVVKAIRLRGVVSQGLIYPLSCATINGEPQWSVAGEGGVDAESPSNNDFLDVNEGDDLAEFLGITKYEPPVPTSMQARVIGADLDATAKYDFENLKKRPDLFEDGEQVVITEKIHGTLIQIGVLPTSMAKEKYYKSRVVISSKGMGANGYVLDHDDSGNLYAQAARKIGLLDKALEVFGPLADDACAPHFIFGEVFGKTPSGKGVQDLVYDGTTLGLRVFDMCVGNRGVERFFHADDLVRFAGRLGVQPVPFLYAGPYSHEIVLKHTDGHSCILGAEHQIREGVVVKSSNETPHPRYGRKIAKSVSDAYLLRKGEVTEFQ